MPKIKPQSTAPVAPVKPEKPRPDFPLFPHPNGQWAKKIKGRQRYFGPWADPEKALEIYAAQRDDLYAGRKPRGKNTEGTTVDEVVNRFLDAKKGLVASGELSRLTWNGYHTTAARVVKHFGRNRLVNDLRSDDFESLRAEIAKTMGAVAIGNEVQRVRSIFKFAIESDLIDRPVKFGPTFKKPTQKVRRRSRQEKGKTLFTAEEIRTMLAAASPPLRAMILLGVNCGLGNHDVATLPINRLDLPGGWHDYWRPKTGMQRRAALWPETVDAIEAWLAVRPEPNDEADAGLVFVTKYRRRWVRLKDDQTSWIDSIAVEMGKLLRGLGLKRPGHGFYTLRRTFRTIADEAKDQPAAMAIMGHADGDADMSAVYRQGIGDDRLQAVAEHVRRWLFPPERKAPGKRKAKAPRRAK